MKKKYKYFLAVLAVLAIGGVLVFQFLSPVAAETEILTPGPLSSSFTAQGTVMPKESHYLNAPAAGVLASLPLGTGAEFQAGQLLALIDSQGQTDILLQLEQNKQQLTAARQQYDGLFGEKGTAANQLTLAESALEEARWNYGQAKSLEEQMPGTVTEAELKRLAGQVTAAEQNLKAAQKENSEENKAAYRSVIDSWERQIAALEENLSGASLTAPFDGVLWQILAEEGTYVSKFQPVARIYPAAGGMKVETRLLLDDAVLVKTGDRAEFVLADGSSCGAEIRFISAVAETGLSAIGIEESRRRVELAPLELPQGVGAGQQVDITFTSLAAQEVLSAPLTAVVPFGEGGSGVYLLKKGRALLTKVETGRKSGGRVELVSGVTAGEELLKDPYSADVKDGVRIREAVH
ncbi:MAG: HlyD family efflux transporter periplasmic adaptor subunit [Peptococcaceae bacterium]|nr:HlyD family efflux transporter periplasmic adaptor subunit [Peptococcaceae bacterium]